MQAVKKFLVSKAKLKESQELADPMWQISPREDDIVSEEPLEIWLKQHTSPATKPERLMITMRSPGDDIHMVRGWLHTSGLLDCLSDIQSVTHTGTAHLKQGASNQVLVTLMPKARINLSQHQRLEYVNSSCGVCGQQSIETLLDKLPKSEKPTKPLITPLHILKLASALCVKQTVFAQTGGNHGAGLFVAEPDSHIEPHLLDVREDVGRHNALDKLIGANLSLLLSKKQIYFGLVLSGRVSFELVQKAAMANVSLIIAMGAPSSLAISLAIESDICIIGFVKKHSFNVYSLPEYIQTQDNAIERKERD